MIVTVRGYADLRLVIGDQEVVLPEVATVQHLLDLLIVDHPVISTALFDQAGALLPAVNILKNGRNIFFLNGLSTLLEEGDLISVFPPVAGG
ncbi:ubiquitin-like small modifier protein 1 [Methanosphaerula palustris]|uniref:MoaD family protein n=1 Tax=Methanosphaerula palustris (strain ATCC BAA-1556 / DSM 19958 / E1-9c) TaxID=521011 RepID=B8GIR4_METPE|nr:ubiquitin-like small modifier protein 1 [Methanosphaerula palustris]ACL16877.1 MoaD family protein [Methanosphaerula palustris E1-9c]